MSDMTTDPVGAEDAEHRLGRNVGRLGSVDSTRLPLLVTWSVLVTSAIVAVAAVGGYGVSAVALGLLALVLAVGWPVLVGAPSQPGVQAVLAVGGLGVAVTVARTTGPQRLLWVPVAVAGAVMLGFLQQVMRPPLRPRLTEGAAAVAAALAAVASGAALVPVTLRPHGDHFIVVGMIGLGAGAIAELSGRHPRIRALAVIPATAAGGLAGGLVAAPLGLLTTVGIGLGMLLASFSHTARRVIGAVPGCHQRIAQVALAVASVLLCGVLVLALASLALPAA